jgi:branched-chain amino acid transport system ATP-binding protein
MAEVLFRTRGLRKRFRGLVATDDVDLELRAGEIHALIGPNGAGKSTLVNLISGALRPDAGTIELEGRRIDTLSVHERVRAGLSRCFQITSLYPALTVRDNLLFASQGRHRAAARPWGTRSAAGWVEKAEALAEEVGLAAVLDRVAGALPHGAQRQLDVALALSNQPKLLLLDEPMAGMGGEESERMADLIDRLRGRMGLLLIEHDMAAVFRLADRISVLVYGRVLATGTVQEIQRNAEVKAVYLGEEVSV